MIRLFAPDSETTERIGALLAEKLRSSTIVYLQGDLGAGKTTLVRGVLRGFGYKRAVKSPTYTLVETYSLPIAEIHHFDLYRLSESEELEFLGVRDYFSDTTICFIEWPEKGAGVIPAPDLRVEIEYADPGRRLTMSGPSADSLTEILASSI